MSSKPPAVAVVDDEADVRRALERLFRSAGFEVETYASGLEFMHSVIDRTPDCLVLDLHMPGMSGFDVQAELAARGIGVPVVVITGNDTPAARARALGNGASAYLCKPVDDEALLAAIEDAIGTSTH